MSPGSSSALAAALEARLLAIDGVRTIFPERAASEALLRLVGQEPAAPARVQVTADSTGITVRFSIRRSAPVRAVALEAAAIAAELVGDRQYRLELEFAHID